MNRRDKPYSGALTRPIPFQYFHLSAQQQAEFTRQMYWNYALRNHKGGLDDFARQIRSIDHKELRRKHEEACQAVLREYREEKLPALLAHYGLQSASDGTHWKELAMELAIRHVAGFKTCRSNGAPKTGKLKDSIIGMRVLRKIKSNPGKSINWACENIGNDFPEMKGKTRTIHRAYYRWLKSDNAKWLVSFEKSHPEKFQDVVSLFLESTFLKGVKTF